MSRVRHEEPVIDLAYRDARVAMCMTLERNKTNIDISSPTATETMQAFDGRFRRHTMYAMNTRELERLVRTSFPGKKFFSAKSDLGLDGRRLPAIAFVHGGPDPYLDHPLDSWLRGGSAFVSLYPLLNRLCRAGALVPGEYAITRG